MTQPPRDARAFSGSLAEHNRTAGKRTAVYKALRKKYPHDIAEEATQAAYAQLWAEQLARGPEAHASPEHRHNTVCMRWEPRAWKLARRALKRRKVPVEEVPEDPSRKPWDPTFSTVWDRSVAEAGSAFFRGLQETASAKRRAYVERELPLLLAAADIDRPITPNVVEALVRRASEPKRWSRTGEDWDAPWVPMAKVRRLPTRRRRPEPRWHEYRKSNEI